MASFNDDYLCNDQQEQTFKSLCLVTSTGTVIKRLADVKGNELHAFIEDTTRPRKFDNRGLLYHNGKFPVGFGIIEWTVAPDRKDSSNDWVPQALMRKAQETPIYIATNYIVTKKQGVNAIIKRLKEVGIKVKAQGEINVLFAYYDTIKGGWEGVLCTKNDCEISDDDVWRLKTETVALPLCTVYPNDKVRVMSGNKRWYFCRKLEPVANKRVFVKSEIEIAKDILVKRLCTKDALRQSALNRVETTKFKEFVNTRRPDQVMSEIQETLSCSHEEAEKYAVHALQLITEALDKEAGKTSLNLEKLRMEEKALQERVVQTETKLRSLERELEECVKAAAEERQRFIEEEAFRRRQYDEAVNAQKVLDQKIAELESQKLRYEEEGDAILKTNESLRQNNAGFIEKNKSLNQECEDLEKHKITLWEEVLALEKENDEQQNKARDFQAMSSAAHLTFTNGQAGNDVRAQASLLALFTSGGMFRPIETDKREKNSAEILAQNLKRRVQSDFYKELAAFLVAAVERREPLILAGPCCERIVDALAAACGGRRSGTLVCDGDWDGNAVAQAEDGDDEIVLVKNALHPRWVDRWPNAVAESSKSWILTTPFVEDLTLLPVGFYNYFAPLLTELLVDDANWEGKPLIAGKNVEFLRGGEKKDDAFEVEGQSFAKMRASAFCVKRLTAMLRRARQIGTETLKFDATGPKRLTLLCGVAPFALATGNLEFLRETFQEEKTGLDAKCRETISRLLGDGDE